MAPFDHEKDTSDVQESAFTSSNKPVTVTEAAFIGGVLAPGLLYFGQAIEPISALAEVPSSSTEFVLLGGLAVAGALIGGVATYSLQRFRQWRDQKLQATALAERIETVATPEYVEQGLDKLNAWVYQQSLR
jgi:hypothetical protein